MHTSPRTRHALHPMDVMRPSQPFAIPSAASAPDPRHWLRLMLVAFVSAIALPPLLGATAPAHAEYPTSAEPAGVTAR